MNILFAASEAVPYCKTGGLADVAGALPMELARAGHPVCAVFPLYRAVNRKGLRLTRTRLHVPLGHWKEPVHVWQAAPQKNLRVFFIDSPNYFDREGLYGYPPGNDFYDNDRRFILFSRAVLELAKAVKFKPDVVHTHDWQTGLINTYLKTVYSRDPFFRKAGSLFTIHNLAYQGLFPETSFALCDLPRGEFSPSGLEFYGKLSLMKGGVVYADALSTVSPTYAREIMSSYEFGWGLETFLKTREDRLRGIVNGLDVKTWNPSTDPHLSEKFGPASLKKRERCRVDLQKAVGFRPGAPSPLVGFIGRLDRQKGVDMIIEAAPNLIQMGAQLVILGVGDPFIQASLGSLQNSHPYSVFVDHRFSEPLAHQIYAGADIFLMPSVYEPCGLGQMIAMRYGALPVVTPTGGLLDTVVPIGWSPGGTGFVTDRVSTAALLETLSRAMDFYRNKKKWSEVQRRGMTTDFSWAQSVPQYIEHYENARRWRKESLRG